MANLVTLLRLLLLFAFLTWVYQSPWQHPLLNVAVLGIIFLMDALDGFVARRYGETTVFGAVLDIAADRVVENLLWLVLVDLDRVPVWVGMIFLTRSFLVDSLRSGGQQAPFEIMRSPLGRFLVKGRFMRFGYALVKF
ncbi:MAG: CDP-alcohol phosphatidyltransferase family protein, partial [Candidatus Competibacteraceae bacterium]|nr:CDP-alcohol phosphatidyltransferase family protein [Candidatus Competibacteraceae bacterium]